MNQPLFLHIAERLEGFLGKLPEKLQRPILHELTPLKELFLKQRQPRLVLTGSHKFPVQEVFAALFGNAETNELRDVLVEVFRWQNIAIGKAGTVSLLDARGADADALKQVAAELRREPADIFLHLVDGNSARPILSRDTENLSTLISLERDTAGAAKVIGLSLISPERGTKAKSEGHAHEDRAQTKLQNALASNAQIRERFVDVLEISLADATNGPRNLMSLLARELPNEARVEMIRISRDRAAQHDIAQQLVKSTSAICTAVGAQPIPLADLPILTTLQLVMISGIMYVSGRERSLRAATEFATALGVNVGAGMVLREGARAVLKFFPGWGNVVCGMVAGAGTYALGRSATAYFVDGVSLKDARQTYLSSRRKSAARKRLTSKSVPR